MNPECQNCPLKDTVERLENKYSESRKQIYKRIDALESNYARTDERWSNVKEDLVEIKAQQKELLAKFEQLSAQPAKRWDTAVSSSISAAVGAIVGAIGALLFGGGMN